MNNRRASERRLHRDSVLLKDPGARQVMAATTLNVSEGGLLVELLNQAPRVPNFVVVHLELGGAPSLVQAVVQRAVETRGHQRLALRFIDLGEQERQLLRMKLRRSPRGG